MRARGADGRRPPRLAAWLLKWMGVAEGNAPLAGDLAEEFENGKSAAWYWRQTLLAVAVSVGQTARARRFHLLAYTLGFGAQAGVVFEMSRHSWPQQLHGFALGAASVLFSGGLFLLFWWKLSRARSARVGEQDRMTIGMATLEAAVTFVVYLLLYMVFAAVLSDTSTGGWIGAEAAWFLTGVFDELKQGGLRSSMRLGSPPDDDAGEPPMEESL